MSGSWAIWIAIGYVLGSVPFALFIGLAKGVDIRKVGSGNVGATNVGRALGRKWGVLCLVLDVIKGFAPVLAAGIATHSLGTRNLPAADAWCWLGVGAAAVIGHVFPVWLRFRGGKGVATSLGVLLGYWPTLTLAGVGAGIVWAVLAKATRYVSVASIGAAVALPILVLAIAPAMGRTMLEITPFLIISLVLAALVVIRHRTNIARLRAGTESKIGAPKEQKT